MEIKETGNRVRDHRGSRPEIERQVARRLSNYGDDGNYASSNRPVIGEVVNDNIMMGVAPADCHVGEPVLNTDQEQD